MSDDAIAVVHETLLLDDESVIAPLGFGFPGMSRPLWRDRWC